MYLHHISSSLVCADIIRKCWINPNSILKIESMYAFYLNDKYQIIYHRLLNIGNHKETNFDSRTATECALFIHSNNIIIAHNHPSGIVTPSQKDIEVTKRLVAFYSVLDINLVDHIILTADDYFSFRDAGLLNI